MLGKWEGQSMDPSTKCCQQVALARGGHPAWLGLNIVPQRALDREH
jgi:hypothetical protein